MKKSLEPKEQIRPSLPNTIVNKRMTDTEQFQNTVLRPIIKLQHEHIVTLFDYFLKSKNIIITSLNETQKTDLIEQKFKSNIQLKTELRGLIIGLFTLTEYKFYLDRSTEVNKRINSIIQQRVSSHFL